VLRLYVSPQHWWVAEHHGLFRPCCWSIVTTATEMPATGPATMGTTRRASRWMGNFCSPLIWAELILGVLDRTAEISSDRSSTDRHRSERSTPCQTTTVYPAVSDTWVRYYRARYSDACGRLRHMATVKAPPHRTNHGSQKYACQAIACSSASSAASITPASTSSPAMVSTPP
jgi:hypothetical protein